MAELTIEGTELVLALTELEKLEAIHGDLRVPVAAVRQVEVLDDALAVVRGLRVGTGIPGVLVVGTVGLLGTKSFVVVHHGHPGGIRVRLEGEDYDELIVGCTNPEAVAAALTSGR